MTGHIINVRPYLQSCHVPTCLRTMGYAQAYGKIKIIDFIIGRGVFLIQEPDWSSHETWILKILFQGIEIMSSIMSIPIFVVKKNSPGVVLHAGLVFVKGQYHHSLEL